MEVRSRKLVITVNYQGKKLEFEVRLRRMGYLHKMEVMINETPILFEPDEEGKYRALVKMEQVEGSNEVSIGLLQAIAQQLESL